MSAALSSTLKETTSNPKMSVEDVIKSKLKTRIYYESSQENKESKEVKESKDRKEKTDQREVSNLKISLWTRTIGNQTPYYQSSVTIYDGNTLLGRITFETS